MWLFTRGGFVSIVEHREMPLLLIVRARVRDDLVRFLGRTTTKIVETPTADYRFRAIVPRNVVAQIIAAKVEEIDYPNFKDAVGAGPCGPERSNLYHHVWLTLTALRDKMFQPTKKRARSA